jgi:hypothetical protein
MAEAAAAPIAEHLVVCDECRSRPAEWDEYVGDMRAALSKTALD